jgi:hypothetical protein
MSLQKSSMGVNFLLELLSMARPFGPAADANACIAASLIVG